MKNTLEGVTADERMQNRSVIWKNGRQGAEGNQTEQAKGRKKMRS